MKRNQPPTRSSDLPVEGPRDDEQGKQASRGGDEAEGATAKERDRQRGIEHAETDADDPDAE